MGRIVLSGLLALLTVFQHTYAAEPDWERDQNWSSYAYDGQQKADGPGVVLTLPRDTVINIDGSIVGSSNYAALYATNDGEIYLTDGFLSLTNVGSVGAATADSNGYIKLDNVRIETYATPGGRWQTGLMARDNGAIDFDNGTIVTMGSFSHGVHAMTGGAVNVANSSIETNGSSAAGAYVGINSTVTFTDTDILTTSSDEGYGLYAIYAGATIIMTNGTLTTEGSAVSAGLPLPAVYGRQGAAITLSNVTLEAKGITNAGGLLSREANTLVTMNGGSIATAGSDSYGAYAIQGGKVVLNESRIVTAGANSHGLWVWDGSFGEMNGGYVRVDAAKGSFAVLTSDTGAVSGQGVYDVVGDIRNINNGSISLNFEAGSVYKGGTDVGGGIIDFTMADSVWTMDKSSILTSLALNGGAINYRTENSRYGTLATTNLTGGDGTFSIRTDVGGEGGGVNNTGDLLIVAGASDGFHHLFVNDTGSQKTIGVERLTVVQTVDGVAEFDLVNGQVDIGAYVYELRRVDEDATDWELYANGQITNPGKETPGLLTNTAYRVNHMENQTLMQRMGELRDSERRQDGIWARYVGGRVNTSSRQRVAGSTMRYHGMQLGLDKSILSVPDSRIYLGVMGGFSRNNTDFAVGDAKTNSCQFGAYGTLKHVNGLYVDAIGRFFQMDHKLKTLTSDYLAVKGDGKSRGFSTGVEAGKRFYVNVAERKKWFVEPEAQITYSRFNSASIKINNGLKTTLRGYDSLLGRAGFLLGYSIDALAAGETDVYVKANYMREFKGNAAYIYNDYDPGKQYYRFGRHWVEAGAGVNTRIRERHNIYADYVYAKGGGFHQHQINVGYRFTF